MVPRFGIGHPGPDLFDNAGPFVAEDDGFWVRAIAFDVVQITVTYATGDVTHTYLPVPGG
jgi:hypothetical protein